jgi:hypothetical protein
MPPQSGTHGAIAQLGERLDRTQEVGGSSPPSSIGAGCASILSVAVAAGGPVARRAAALRVPAKGGLLLTHARRGRAREPAPTRVGYGVCAVMTLSFGGPFMLSFPDR